MPTREAQQQTDSRQRAVSAAMPQEEGAIVNPAGDTLLRVGDSRSDLTKVGQSCSRRYSEVMREYLRRKRQRNDVVDDHNIKPSEVVTRQADHASPSDYSYVRWDNPEAPGILDLDTRQIPAIEEPCQVSNVRVIHNSPRLSPYSITPESGADSFNTAKTHVSSTSSMTPLPPRASFSNTSLPLPPQRASPDMRSSGLDSFRPSDHTNYAYKTPVITPLITVFSESGSPKLTVRHDEDEDDDYDQSDEGENYCEGALSALPPGSHLNHSWGQEIYTSASRTFVVKPNFPETFEGEKCNVTFGDQSMTSDNSLMRETVQDDHLSLPSPMVLNFDEASFKDMDFSNSRLEVVGQPCYPPDETGSNLYNLVPMSPQSSESERTQTFSWLTPHRQGNSGSLSRAAITAELKKVKRTKRISWGLCITGIFLLFATVVIYFVLEYKQQ